MNTSVLIEPRDRSVGSIVVKRLLPWHQRRMVGPFIFLDVMGPIDFVPGTGMDVDAHPHIGLSTLTYLLQGRALHRDPLGSVQTIEAGEVNWMTSGAGITHTERSLDIDRTQGAHLFGVQTWVALPEGAEDADPSFEHASASAAPTFDIGRSSIRLLAGTGWGSTASVLGSSPLVLGDLSLAGDHVELPDDHSELAVLSIEGDIEIGGQRLEPGWLATVDDRRHRTITGTGRAIVLGGEPVGPRRIWWNFAHSDPERIEDAKQRWKRQEFPLVPGDHNEFIALPNDGHG